MHQFIGCCCYTIKNQRFMKIRLLHVSFINKQILYGRQACAVNVSDILCLQCYIFVLCKGI